MALLPADESLPDDQVMLIDAARDFARDELAPLDPQWDEGHGTVFDVLPRLADMGFLNLSIPEQFNGLGCPYRTYAAIIHEISYASPSVAVVLSVHNMVGSILAKNAVEPLRTQWVSAWGRPESFAAFAISEAGAGSDPAAARAAVREVQDGYIINGEKMWITNGMQARWFLTLGRMDGGPHDGKLVALVLDGNQPGVQRVKIHGKMGIRGSETAVIHLADAFAPRSHLIGDIGDGLKVCLSTLNEGRIGIASQASGIAEACLDAMVSYARTREQFGQPIGKFQAVAEMIASSAMELEATRALIWRAASFVDDGLQSRSASSMAKLYASEAANRIAYRAVQVHGGAGFVHECRVEQLYRDVRVTTIYEGTSEVQRIVIARDLTGRW